MSVRLPKKQERFEVLCAPLLLVVAAACSSGSQSNTLCVPTSGTTVASNLAMNLSPAQPQLTANGTGFIDIETKDDAGTPQRKRCTMTLRPADESNTSVRVWTAGHCAYDPQTVEFKNSTYTLKVFYKNGYFSVPVEFDGFASLSKFADFVNGSLVRAAVPDLDRHLGSAMPSAADDRCVKQEEKFRVQLGTSAKNIACFSRNEMRGLKAQLRPTENVKVLLKTVLDELRIQESAVMSGLDGDLKKRLNAYLTAHMTEQRRVSDLRSVAYLLNKQFCNATPDARPAGDNGNVDIATGCNFRASALSQLETGLSKQDFSVIKAVVDDETTPLQELRNKTMGCNYVSVENITSVTDLSALTPCDMGNLSDTFWKKYVDQGPTFTGAQESTTTFGLSDVNYFGFFTNSIKAGKSSTAKLFSLNGSVVSDFEYAMRLDSGAKLNHNVFLINYDKNKQGIDPVKGASGSILSIFGSIPAALLSTVDGEATSGGAGVTPLPEITDDDALPPSNAGC
jgi:hypothetical protein